MAEFGLKKMWPSPVVESPMHVWGNLIMRIDMFHRTEPFVTFLEGRFLGKVVGILQAVFCH